MPAPLKNKISSKQEALLWENKVFSLDSSNGLLQAVIFYLIKSCGVHQGRDLRKLETKHVTFGEDTLGKFVCIDFKPITVYGKKIKHYEDLHNPRSLYKILQAYLKCIYNEGAFLLRPISSIKHYNCYSPWPLGVAIIDHMVQTLMGEIGEYGNYGNTSAALLAIDVLKSYGAGKHCLATYADLFCSQSKSKVFNWVLSKCNNVNCREKNPEAGLIMSHLLDPPYPPDISAYARELKTMPVNEIEIVTDASVTDEPSQTLPANVTVKKTISNVRCRKLPRERSKKNTYIMTNGRPKVNGKLSCSLQDKRLPSMSKSYEAEPQLLESNKESGLSLTYKEGGPQISECNNKSGQVFEIDPVVVKVELDIAESSPCTDMHSDDTITSNGNMEAMHFSKYKEDNLQTEPASKKMRMDLETSLDVSSIEQEKVSDTHDYNKPLSCELRDGNIQLNKILTQSSDENGQTKLCQSSDNFYEHSELSMSTSDVEDMKRTSSVGETLKLDSYLKGVSLEENDARPVEHSSAGIECPNLLGNHDENHLNLVTALEHWVENLKEKVVGGVNRVEINRVLKQATSQLKLISDQISATSNNSKHYDIASDTNQPSVSMQHHSTSHAELSAPACTYSVNTNKDLVSCREIIQSDSVNDSITSAVDRGCTTIRESHRQSVSLPPILSVAIPNTQQTSDMHSSSLKQNFSKFQTANKHTDHDIENVKKKSETETVCDVKDRCNSEFDKELTAGFVAVLGEDEGSENVYLSPPVLSPQAPVLTLDNEEISTCEEDKEKLRVYQDSSGLHKNGVQSLDLEHYSRNVKESNTKIVSGSKCFQTCPESNSGASSSQRANAQTCDELLPPPDLIKFLDSVHNKIQSFLLPSTSDIDLTHASICPSPAQSQKSNSLLKRHLSEANREQSEKRQIKGKCKQSPISKLHMKQSEPPSLLRSVLENLPVTMASSCSESKNSQPFSSVTSPQRHLFKETSKLLPLIPINSQDLIFVSNLQPGDIRDKQNQTNRVFQSPSTSSAPVLTSSVTVHSTTKTDACESMSKLRAVLTATNQHPIRETLLNKSNQKPSSHLSPVLTEETHGVERSCESDDLHPSQMSISDISSKPARHIRDTMSYPQPSIRSLDQFCDYPKAPETLTRLGGEAHLSTQESGMYSFLSDHSKKAVFQSLTLIPSNKKTKVFTFPDISLVQNRKEELAKYTYSHTVSSKIKVDSIPYRRCFSKDGNITNQQSRDQIPDKHTQSQSIPLSATSSLSSLPSLSLTETVDGLSKSAPCTSTSTSFTHPSITPEISSYSSSNKLSYVSDTSSPAASVLPSSSSSSDLLPKCSALSAASYRHRRSEICIGDYLPQGSIIPASSIRVLTQQGENGLELVLAFDHQE